MKIRSAQDSTITISRYGYEGLLMHTLTDLTVTLIPLASAMIYSAVESKADAESPQFMAAFSLYFHIVGEWNTSVMIARELAKDDTEYKTAIQMLGLDANPEPLGLETGKTENHLHEIEIRISQWRMNIQKFIRIIDPDSPALFIRHAFDSDPPA